VKFKYLGAETRYLPALELYVNKGDEFEATGDLAQGLIDQTDLYERTDKKES
jgi:hypothetical protein